MASKQRGPAPNDAALFAPERIGVLRTAVDELSWLLGRGYAERSALELVGNRHALEARARRAVGCSAASPTAVAARKQRQVEPSALTDAVVHVDGFNVIIVGESVFSGGVVLVGRDGAHRDLASVHGTYGRVSQTEGVLDALARQLAPARQVVWYLDRPVSNSGRLAGLIREHAPPGVDWTVELVWDPDRVLVESEAIVASADARILDAPVRWVDLPGALVDDGDGQAWVVDLEPPGSR